jgi:hypothetical protein
MSDPSIGSGPIVVMERAVPAPGSQPYGFHGNPLSPGAHSTLTTCGTSELAARLRVSRSGLRRPGPVAFDDRELELHDEVSCFALCLSVPHDFYLLRADAFGTDGYRTTRPDS